MSLSRLWEYRKWIGYGILFVAFIILLSQAKITWKDTVRETGSDGNISVTGEEISGLPEDHQFRQVAENERLRLKFHDRTGHFIVEDKLNGNLWRSFPDRPSRAIHQLREHPRILVFLPGWPGRPLPCGGLRGRSWLSLCRDAHLQRKHRRVLWFPL